MSMLYNETPVSTSGMTYISTDGSRLRLFVPYAASQPATEINLASRNWKLYWLDGDEK